MTTTSASAPILVLNAGSSSIKAALIAVEAAQQSSTLWQGQRPWTPALASGEDVTTLRQAVTDCLDPWLSEGIEPWRQEISLVAHRVVHGGARFSQPTRFDERVRDAITETTPLAPLHNGAALAVIAWMNNSQALWPQPLPQWVCFDTAFHSTLSEPYYSYAIPAAWRARGLRRFGFHGLNHQHIAETTTAIRLEEGASEADLQELRLISAHLGAGCSLCAIRGGRSVATSMGLTPMEGLVMATRSGSVDPGLLLHLLRHEGLDADALDEALNHQSGLLGLSELSGDMRVLRQAAAQGHTQAQLALDVFSSRLLEGIGAMAAALGGVDVIALSGGIGQNDEVLAHTLHSRLSWLGRFRLLQIPADEEGQIARQCAAAAGLIPADA